MAVGLYQKKLYRIFMIIAIIITLISCVLFSTVFYSVNYNAYKEKIRDFAIVKMDNIRLAVEVISSSHDKLKADDNVIGWAYSATGSSDYYYHSVRIYQKLAKKSSAVTDLDYENVVTKVDDATFAITQVGTIDKQTYINEHIGRSTWNTILSMRTGSGIVPFYENGELSSIVYYTFGTSNLLLITKFPMSTFAKDSDNFAIALNNDIYAKEQYKDRSDLQKYVVLGKNSVAEYISHSEFVYVVKTSIPGLTFLYLYPRYSSALVSVIISSAVLLVVLLAFSFYITLLVVKKLYAPIFNIVSKLELDEQGETDEFAILAENIDSLELLRKQLNELREENTDYAITRYFNELLYTPEPLQKAPIGNLPNKYKYSVALFEYQYDDSKNDEYYLQFERASMMVLLKELSKEIDFYYINLSSTRFALVIENEETEVIKEKLQAICDDDALDIDIALALSDSRFGQAEIYKSFNQVERIIEYKHLLRLNNVLMQCDMPRANSDYFYYPMVMENKIVSCALVGDTSGLENAFDSVMYENSVILQLNSKAHQTLMYLLIGTLIRIMQELKVSAKELFGRDLDFPYLYSNWASDRVVERLRLNFHDISEAVSERRKLSKSDEYLLDKMRDYIFNNYSDDIMLIDISEYCNITPKYCSSLFKKLSNENFKTFLNEYRVERAAEKIKEDPYIKINDLALSVGFNSANTFIRVFKSFQNITPKAYAELILSEKKENMNDQG